MDKKKRANQFNICKAKENLIRNINRTFNTNFSQFQVRKKLLLELGEELTIIMSNADKLENLSFCFVHQGAASPSG